MMIVNMNRYMKKYGLLCCITVMIFSACKQTEIEPLNKSDKAPDPVSNVKVQSFAGGAVISYDRPENMLYVKAEYSPRPGLNSEVKATYYKNELRIDGFADTEEHEVKLYAVSRGENASAPVTVKFRPLTPPIVSVFQSLKFEAIYGGIRLNFENSSEANIVINLLRPDATGEYVPADAFYTKRKGGFMNSRGFEPIAQKFAIFIRDRWGNHSDTAYTELTPLFEQQLDRTKFKEVRLPTDTYTQHTSVGGSMVSLWDNVWNGGNTFHTKPGSGLPQYFTFDLGVSVNLSRFKFYHRRGGGQQGTDGAYFGGDPKIFDLYGSNAPAQDGSWESWTLIGEFESIKPSGSPAGIVSNEDFQYAVIDGEEFDIPENTPKFRYLRWRTRQVWGTLDHIYMTELQFWGGKE